MGQFRPPHAPFIHFVRARMHRRIFMWFGATILFSVALVALVMRFMLGEPAWKHDYERAQLFLTDRFADVWNDPAARAELARRARTELDVTLSLVDDNGTAIDDGGADCRHPVKMPVRDNAGHVLGALKLCTGRAQGFGVRLAISLFVGLFTIWAATGVIARRLSRPLYQVACVAKEIGRGNLAARVRVGRHHHGEVRVLAASLNDMATRIEKQLADQRALLATVSHEIRTPLARVRLLVELARGGDPSALSKLEAEVGEIDRLVGDLLASSRIDFSAMNTTRLDASTVAQEAIERAGVDPTKLVVDDGSRLVFDGDATLVSRAVANLIENAERHGGGLVSLHVRRRTHEVVFEAEDAGVGFLPGEPTKIFEAFYRRSKSETSLGLGLALVKRIAEAHGGRAWADNRPEGGALVAIALPLSQA